MKILFLGGDTRFRYMMDDLCKMHNVSQIGFDISNDNIYAQSLDTLDLSKYDIVIFPISGISNNLEVKTEKGNISLSDKIFDNLGNNTLFFTGLKTDKLLELIPESQLISFLDFKEVEDVNNELTIEGTLADIKEDHPDSVCVIRIWKTWQRIILAINRCWSKNFYNLKTKRTNL